MVSYSFRWPRLRVLAVLVIGSLLILYALRHSYSLRNLLSYSTRPIWDSDDSSPHLYLPHLYAEGVPPDDLKACQRHGWTARPTKPRLIDAVIFSTELDLLEIRMRELWDVVDTFVVVESGHTFTGKPKNLTFAENRFRFTEFESKISYTSTAGRELRAGEDEFTIEAEMRGDVGRWLLTSVRPPVGSLLLMSDVDEIPSAHTMALIKACEAPLPLHLQLRNYVYSFEFPTDWRSWRAQVHSWQPGVTVYKHGKSADRVLTDAGWHCSFCFRHLSDFAFKMASYSHSDRLFGNANWKSFLDPDRIQGKICAGKDLFDMVRIEMRMLCLYPLIPKLITFAQLPEVYTWSELLDRWSGATRTASGTHLPKAVIEDPVKYKFLLPLKDACIRER